MDQVLKKVLGRIKPTSEEELFVKRISDEVMKKIKVRDAKVILGGSGAKGTWMKGTHDVDIYVKFDLKRCRDKDISKVLAKELKKKFSKVLVLHGSRDYFRINKDKFTFEIVPILDIKKASEAVNITDISPLHTVWVRKHAKLADDIRLAKAFCRAQSCYGAESYIRGFSGYVLEILVIYYGSFKNFVKAVANWKQKEHIDVMKHGVELNRAKTQSPLILIDPVQADRNAAAALGREQYDKLIAAAKKFLSSPSEDFFVRKEFSLDDLKKKAKGKSLVVFEAVPLKGKEDVVGAKLLKAFNYIRNLFLREGFTVYDSSWYWDGNAFFYLIVNPGLLPEFKIHVGPKASQQRHSSRFREKNRKYAVYEDRGRLCAKIPRRFRDASSFSKNLIKDENLKLWVKSVRILV
ncbi:MAG: CCA tRNA nucleotidyltransferase [archaeon]